MFARYTLIWYIISVIINFKDQATQDVFHGVSSKKALKIPGNIWIVTQRKLDMLNAARDPRDLRVPPNNRLEALKGDLKNYYSIRINDQFRLIFKWVLGNATDVQITDYH